MAAILTTAVARLIHGTPLRHGRFRRFYLGSIAVALGYTMQATVAAWLMATMTPSALMVALVQTASTLPTLLFGLIAGALADIVDRRRIILVTQLLLIAATAILGLVTLAGWMVPSLLLLLTFMIGAAFTFYLPAQQASINDLVIRIEVPAAVALGAVAFNVSRAAGPALAGTITAWLGSGSALLASAMLFGAMVFAIRGWKKAAPALPGVPETIVSGVLAGVRFARHSPPMRAIILRNLSFASCASALWALMPVIARDQLGLGAGGFGLLLASFGFGAVAGALSIPRQLKRQPLNSVVSWAALLWVIASLLIAITDITALAVVGAFACGAAWVGVLASLSAGTQSTAPAWVRARAVAMSLVAVQASLAVGSIVWGTVASIFDTRVALAMSALLMAVLLVVYRGIRVHLGSETDVTPGAALPDFVVVTEPEPDDGPVLIQIEYRVEPANGDAFLRAVHALGPTRRRNGATSWRVFRDLGETGRFVERYILSSWAEYVRLRSRMTVADRQLQEKAASFQVRDVPIRVSRLLGVNLDGDGDQDE